MIQGTTPTHTFKMKYNVESCKSVRIIYAQEDKVLFKKTSSQCSLRGNEISTTLTQEETMKFDHKKLVQIQARGLTPDGKALITPIKLVTVGQCLDDEVLL